MNNATSMRLPSVMPRACVPIVAADAAEVLRQAQAIRAHDPPADLVELRADRLGDITPENIASLLTQLHNVLLPPPHSAEWGGGQGVGVGPLPLLFTNRRAGEGGAWAGTEADRLAVISAAIASDQIAWVDIEWGTEAIARVDLLTQAEAASVDVIISAHDFAATPTDSELDRLLADLISAGGDAAKLAVTAQTPDDALRLLRATARAASAPIPLITLAMGAAGSITRLAGPFFGSALTFATVGPTSAPGQLPLALVRDYWRAAGLRS